jgi:polysaccharide biosynthesis protein PelA
LGERACDFAKNKTFMLHVANTTQWTPQTQPPAPTVLRLLIGSLLMILALVLLGTNNAVQAQSHDRPSDISVALHYSAAPPLDQLRGFDVVVVDPDHPIDPLKYREHAQQRSQLYAYVSVGEVLRSRAYFERLPTAWLIGQNASWDSQVIDQSADGWPEFFVEKIVRPLWQKGYRGFFFDTMDSYTLIAKDAASIKQQQDGVLRVLSLLHQRLPQARLIMNRGFEFLPFARQQVQAIAAESLFGRWDSTKKSYGQVPLTDRQWLLEQFQKARTEFGIQPIAIEYVDPRKRAAMRSVARQVLELGITPYVTDADLSSLGMGAFEVAPRRVLLLHEGSIDGEEHSSPAQRNLVMPLQYLGYRVDLLDFKRKPLPKGLLADRYAAVVAWISEGDQNNELKLLDWYRGVIEQGVKLVVLNSFGVPIDAKLSQHLGLTGLSKALSAPLRITERDPMFGFEFEPLPNRFDAAPVLANSNSKSLLKISDARGQTYDGAAITAWGGFVMAPFTITQLPGTDGARWIVNPIDFFARAIDNRQMPVPDVTTEVGRRVLMVHIDGDGFPSRAEVPGSPFASELMYRDFIARYKIPHTVSVIEAEVSNKGLYAAWSGELEGIARKIFALPHVEIATHTYTHPFVWRAIVEGKTDRPYNLKIPGYQFDLKREFSGSANYINSRLAPPGKTTRVLLWSGDCVPPATAIEASYTAGLLNMNGGDTEITNRAPTYTQVSPMSIRKSGWLQVLAPNQNENVYTKDWTGPFYGFDKILETFALTDAPRRIKPMNLYYHTYAASKPASIASLHKIYQYVMAQPNHPIFGSDYILRVHEFEELALLKDLQAPNRWRIAGHNQLRTVRWPVEFAQGIDWQRSAGLVGDLPAQDGQYLHLSGASDWFESTTSGNSDSSAAEPMVKILSANGRIEQFSRDSDGVRFTFRSNVAGELLLAHKSDCKVTTNQRILKAIEAKSSESTLKSRPNGLSYQVPESNTRDGVVVSVRC